VSQTPSPDSPVDDQHLIRYVLDLVPPDEAQRLDEASIIDDRFVERLTAVETDLVDAYVRGTLDPDTRSRFELCYLASPRRRQAVRFATRFVDAVDRASPPEQRRTRWKTTGLLTVAAVLIVTLGSVLLLVRPGFEEGARTAASVPESSGTVVPAAAPLSIVLLPQTRSPGTVPSIVVPRSADAVAVDLRVDDDDFRRYRAVLQDPDTKRVLWRSETLTAEPSPEVLRLLRVPVPATLLQRQSYAIELSGVDRAGRAQVLASYVFVVGGP
jgi:hypothetical protein